MQVPDTMASAKTAPIRLAGDPLDQYGREERAQELYLDAMEKLDVRRVDSARAIFRDLLTRFPETAAASLARRRLGELKTEDAALKAAAPARAAPPPVVPRRAVGSGPVWEQELRRNSSIQARLRTEAGDRVFFSAGSAELGSRARSALAAQARWLNRWHEFEAAIEGHADEHGTDQENVRLSEERAEAVRRRLVEEGVDPSRLAIIAQGRTHRVAICGQPECSAQNRRTVTLVFVSGTIERLGLNTGPVASGLGEVAAGPPGGAQPLPIPLAAE